MNIQELNAKNQPLFNFKSIINNFRQLSLKWK